jgi:hypothetical protein
VVNTKIISRISNLRKHDLATTLDHRVRASIAAARADLFAPPSLERVAAINMMHAAANSSSVVAARAVTTTRGAKDVSRSGVSKIVTRASTSTSTRATAGDEDDARVGFEGGKAMAATAFAVSAIVGAVDAAEAYEAKVRFWIATSRAEMSAEGETKTNANARVKANGRRRDAMEMERIDGVRLMRRERRALGSDAWTGRENERGRGREPGRGED